MIKEIKYNGFTEAPSDYESPDGDLARVVGLVPEDETIRPIVPPKQLFSLPTGYSVEYIHKGTNYTHYIVRNGNALYWFDGALITGQLPVTIIVSNLTSLSLPSTNIYQTKSLGNTIIVLTESGLHYFLWKRSAYTYLGTHLPELPISFGLQGRKYKGEDFNIEHTFTCPALVNALYPSVTLDDPNAAVVTNSVLARVNTFLADYYTNGNEFVYPFFVRYAYRLYDGTLTMHSAPVLMCCSSGMNPYVFAQSETYDHQEGTVTSINGCAVYGALFKLDFAVVDQSYITKLQDWSDIISSVDVFISQPLYSYDQSGKCNKLEWVDGDIIGYKDEYCVCKATHADANTYGARYQYHTMAMFMHYGGSSVGGLSIDLPMKGAKTQNESIINTGNFYYLHSYKLTELSTTRNIIEIESGYLQSLVNRERMTDDYDSHADLIAKFGFVYNSRLNIAGISRLLPNGFHMGSLLNYTNGFVNSTNGDITQPDTTYKDWLQYVKMRFHVNTQGEEKVINSLEQEAGGGLFDLPGWACGMFTPTPFIYYPDKNAYKGIITWTKYIDPLDPWGGYTEVHREIPLGEHPMLNGAYYFGWNQPAGTVVSSVTPATSRAIEVPNKIYCSEVNDPFNFPASGIVTVGTGTIINISAAVKALSQGQFGQFPLYAFTDDGVWALEVTSTGTISARQPITRDVCINPESVTQIDTAVLFATERGIMLISGSNSSCISDSIDSPNPFSIASLPGIGNVSPAYAIDMVPFKEYIKGCSMLYDYTHQRIIVYNPTTTIVNGSTQLLYDYAYVYSLKSKMWGMMLSTIKQTINSYPDALAEIDVVQGGETPTVVNMVTNFSSEDPSAATGLQGLIVTRPLKIDAPDVLKTIDTIIQRGYFQKGHVKTILYGSRDLIHWLPVYSSTDHYLRGFRGTPYKYFRIALVTNLDKDESIFGCTVQYTQRLTDQPR